ncbi:hypothetical protein [Paenibacillus sp. GYB003]|uniref:hypothetical protein n=1 Tax=Paenibacillus sp. GYB003 TaxID=2994392 RepID=UPI002F969F25
MFAIEGFANEKNAKAWGEQRLSFPRPAYPSPAGRLESYIDRTGKLPLIRSPSGIASKYREKLTIKWRCIGEMHGMDEISGTLSRCFARKREATENSGNISVSLPAPLPFRHNQVGAEKTSPS